MIPFKKTGELIYGTKTHAPNNQTSQHDLQCSQSLERAQFTRVQSGKAETEWRNSELKRGESGQVAEGQTVTLYELHDSHEFFGKPGRNIEQEEAEEAEAEV